MYNIKNEQGEYFVDWLVNDELVFNKDRAWAKELSNSGANNLVTVLHDMTGKQFEVLDVEQHKLYGDYTR